MGTFFASILKMATDALPEVKLFEKWSFDDVVVSDISLEDYLALKQKFRFYTYVPHTAGRYNAKRFRKSQCPLVERLAVALMRKGRNSGKKLMAARIVEHAFEIINILTDQNPIQVLVDAVINSGPREDSTRIGRGGSVRRQAVDVSPIRRVRRSTCSPLARATRRSATQRRLPSASPMSSSTRRVARRTRTPSRRRTSSSASPSRTVKQQWSTKAQKRVLSSPKK